MKSKEEFIAGIYEKAATYTEEKENNVIKINWVARATRIAAMATVCIGLAGVGSLVLGNGNRQGQPNRQTENADAGIALTAETGEHAETATPLRIGPSKETATFSGVVTNVSAEEKLIWMELVFDASLPNQVEGTRVCVQWDFLEPVAKEIVVGAKLTVSGAVSQDGDTVKLVLSEKESFNVK